MNQPRDPFEQELASHAPRALPPALKARLVAARTGPQPTRPARPLFRLLALAAVLALSVSGLWILRSGEQASPPAPAVEAPADLATPTGLASSGMRVVHMEERLASQVDEGIVFLDGRIGMQQMRYQFFDTVVWENPRDGRTVAMTVPREEIVFVPVAAY